VKERPVRKAPPRKQHRLSESLQDDESKPFAANLTETEPFEPEIPLPPEVADAKPLDEAVRPTTKVSAPEPPSPELPPFTEVTKPKSTEIAEAIKLEDILEFMSQYDLEGTDVQTRKKRSEMVREVQEMVRGKQVTARFLVENVIGPFRKKRFEANGHFVREIPGRDELEYDHLDWKLLNLQGVNAEDINIGDFIRIDGTLVISYGGFREVYRSYDPTVTFVGGSIKTGVCFWFSKDRKTLEKAD